MAEMMRKCYEKRYKSDRLAVRARNITQLSSALDYVSSFVTVPEETKRNGLTRFLFVSFSSRVLLVW